MSVHVHMHIYNILYVLNEYLIFCGYEVCIQILGVYHGKL